MHMTRSLRMCRLDYRRMVSGRVLGHQEQVGGSSLTRAGMLRTFQLTTRWVPRPSPLVQAERLCDLGGAAQPIDECCVVTLPTI